MVDDKLYMELWIDLDRFMNICNIEDFTKKDNYKKFANMIHDLNDQIYLLEIIDKKEKEDIEII